MVSGKAGRVYKLRNRYKRNCIIRLMLDVVEENIISCMFEGLGTMK